MTIREWAQRMAQKRADSLTAKRRKEIAAAAAAAGGRTRNRREVLRLRPRESGNRETDMETVRLKRPKQPYAPRDYGPLEISEVKVGGWVEALVSVDTATILPSGDQGKGWKL